MDLGTLVALLLVALGIVGYAAGRMARAPLLLDVLALAGLLCLGLLTALDPVALVGGLCGLLSGLYGGSLGAVKQARGMRCLSSDLHRLLGR